MGLPFIKISSKRRDQVVAIDLGGRMTKAVHLQRRGDKLNLVNYAFVETPVSDKALSTEALTEHLKNVSRALAGNRPKQVTVALGVNDTVFRQIEMALLPVGDVRQMLKLNSKNYLQQELPDHVFDCSYGVSGPLRQPGSGEAAKPVMPASHKHKMFVGAARRQLIEDLQTAIRGAGMVPDQVVPGLLGPLNAFELAEPEVFGREIVALVEVGFRCTSITILDCGEIRLHRVVAIGGDRLTTGLADTMKITYTEAESIKVGMPQEVQANLEAMLSPLGRELRASIDFCEHQHDRTVSQVFISGGSARSDIIVQALQTELLVPCKAWLPTRALTLSLPPEKLAEVEQLAPQLSVAVGAALVSF